MCKGNSWSRVFWALRATFPRLAGRSHAVRDSCVPASALPWPSLYLPTFVSRLIMFPKHRELAWSLSRHTTTYPDAQTLRWTLPSFYIPAFRDGPSRDAPCAPLCSPFKRTCSLSSVRVLRVVVGSRRVVTPAFGHYLHFCSFLCCSSSFPIGTTLSSSLCHL